MSKYPEKCHVAGCPCREWSAKSPSESPTTGKGDAGFLVPEAKNVSSGQENAENRPQSQLEQLRAENEVLGSEIKEKERGDFDWKQSRP